MFCEHLAAEILDCAFKSYDITAMVLLAELTSLSHGEGQQQRSTSHLSVTLDEVVQMKLCMTGIISALPTESELEAKLESETVSLT